jgi:hypothetical protein
MRRDTKLHQHKFAFSLLGLVQKKDLVNKIMIAGSNHTHLCTLLDLRFFYRVQINVLLKHRYYLHVLIYILILEILWFNNLERVHTPKSSKVMYTEHQ